MKKNQVLKQLFFSTLYLSAFTFGGGYVIVTLMKQKFVDQLQWIDEKEMLDLTAIAQSAPGAIAVNGAIVIGYKLAGLLGVAVATIATIIPPFVIISIISLCYQAFISNQWIALMLQGMQAGVAAVILAVSVQMAYGLYREHDYKMFILLGAAFVFNTFFNINVIYIILGTIILAIAMHVVGRKGK